MPELSRMVITDSLRTRYERSRLIVLGVFAALLALYAFLIISLKPSFFLFVLCSGLFALFLSIGIMRNPLGILTMRVQKKLSVREILFDRTGFSVIGADGEAYRFEEARAELFFINGPGGFDYYLQASGKNGGSRSFYLGNDYDQLEAVGEALAASGVLVKNEAAPN